MGSTARFVSAISVGVLLVALGLISVVNLSSHWSGNPLESADIRSNSTPSIQTGTIAAGKMAANFNLKDLNGTPVSLSGLRGKVVFLNVWATWCAPCREEMPSIQSLYNEFKKDKDFVVLAVSQDTDGSKAVTPFVENNGLHFTVLLDPANDVGESYGVNGIPETFIIGRDGRIVAHHVGPYDWANPEIREALLELIKSKQG